MRNNNRPYMKNRSMINNSTPVNQQELQDARIALSSLKMKMNQNKQPSNNNMQQPLNNSNNKYGEYYNQPRPQTKQHSKPQNYYNEIEHDNNYNQPRPQTKQQYKSQYIANEVSNQGEYYNQNQQRPQTKQQPKPQYNEPNYQEDYSNQNQYKPQLNPQSKLQYNNTPNNQQEEYEYYDDNRALHQKEDINKYEVDDNSLSPCPDCGKMFAQLPLSKHVKICKKVFMKKRKPFDSKKARITDEEHANFMKQAELEAKKKENYNKNAIQSKIPKWKRQSDQLRQIAQANREEDSKL